ncbi:MAG: biotin/lipoyl-containing protein, partial [Myxococcota bacterium]
LAAQGDELDEGAAVVVVEAMKMEHQLRAPFAARVATLDCAEGDQVDMGQVLVRLERRDEES